MAFGSFFKRIINGAKNLATKALPYIQKGLDVVHKVAPTASAIASQFGPVGKTIGGAINKAGYYAGETSRYIDRMQNGSKRQFDVPKLKT